MRYKTPGDDQKTAEAELEFFFLKIAETNVGQWWENVGGPHLAKGGSHDDFKKMMDKEKLPEHIKKKFMDVAKKKYPPGHNMGEGAKWDAARQRGGVGTRPSWAHAGPPRSGFMGHLERHPHLAGVGVAAGLVGAGYLADKYNMHKAEKKKSEAAKQTQKAAASVDDVTLLSFLDELENIKAAGLLDSVKKVLTTPIPGTPEIMPGVTHAAEKLKGLSGNVSKQGPSKAYEKFVAQRAAAGR